MLAAGAFLRARNRERATLGSAKLGALALALMSYEEFLDTFPSGYVPGVGLVLALSCSRDAGDLVWVNGP